MRSFPLAIVDLGRVKHGSAPAYAVGEPNQLGPHLKNFQAATLPHETYGRL
jgi:hypothetical protein